jgi:hypothetical protein
MMRKLNECEIRMNDMLDAYSERFDIDKCVDTLKAAMNKMNADYPGRMITKEGFRRFVGLALDDTTLHLEDTILNKVFEGVECVRDYR